MAKTLIRKIGPYATLYRDRKSGVAWVEDTHSGTGHSAHPNIDASGSVAGMKRKGWWGKKDRTARAHGFIYNIDILHVSDDYDVIAARACQCGGNHGVHEGKAPGGKKRHTAGKANPTTKKRCKWFAGILKEGAEVLCLGYTPTGSHNPKGWRYAFGPSSTRKEAIQVANYQGHRVVNLTAKEKRTPLRDSPEEPGTKWTQVKREISAVKALLK